VEPRWSDTVRKGKMRGYVSRVIEPEEYKQLTNDEFFTLIEKELYVNEAEADARFLSEVRAEYLERVIYVCPDCGLSVFESHGNEIECKKCHKKIHYGEDKRLTGEGFEFPFPFVLQWYEYQKDYVCNLDLRNFTEEALYEDVADLSEVVVYKKKVPLCKGVTFKLYGDRITVVNEAKEELVFPFDKVSAMAVLGRNKLNVYYKEKVYQIKGGKRFNAVKYVNFYFRYRNILKGDQDGKFLGL
jgi:1-acyl-sn-glycerol-3-phosphate acyltransferase